MTSRGSWWRENAEKIVAVGILAIIGAPLLAAFCFMGLDFAVWAFHDVQRTWATRP